MKTKIGKKLVKINSKKMEKLNIEFIELAKKLDTASFDVTEPRKNDYRDPSDFQRFLDEVKKNREEHDALQIEINTMCLLESWLEFA